MSSGSTPNKSNKNNGDGKDGELHDFDCYCPCVGGSGNGTLNDQILLDDDHANIKLTMNDDIEDGEDIGKVRSLGNGDIPFDEGELPAPKGRRSLRNGSGDEQKTVEIVWDGDDEKEKDANEKDNGEILDLPSKERSILERMLGISRDTSSLTGYSGSMAALASTKEDQSNVALVDNGETVETQHPDEDGTISIDSRNGEPTKVTWIGKSRNNRRQKYLWLVLFLFAVAGFITALIVGVASLRRNKSQNGTSKGDDEGDILGQQQNKDIGIPGTNHGVGGTLGGGSSIGILSTGCFRYDETNDLVCLTDDNPNDSLCSFTINGGSCGCVVCNEDTGAIRVDCSGIIASDNAIMNDSCLNPDVDPDVYDDTLLEAFTGHEEASSLGSWESEVGEELGATDVENIARGESPFTTGCFDYKFRLHGGVVVCLEDEDTSDDICILEVDGESCDSCSVCDPTTGAIRADCSSLRLAMPIINDACDSDIASAADGTILEAFLDDSPNDSDRSDGFWIERDMVGVCQDAIETGFLCYGVGHDLEIGFKNCEPAEDDWIGIYAPDADPNNLGDPINNNWWWTCGPTQCDQLFNTGVLYFTADVEPGNYRAFLIRGEELDDGRYEAYAWSDTFEVHYDESTCEDGARFLL